MSQLAPEPDPVEPVLGALVLVLVVGVLGLELVLGVLDPLPAAPLLGLAVAAVPGFAAEAVAPVDAEVVLVPLLAAGLDAGLSLLVVVDAAALPAAVI